MDTRARITSPLHLTKSARIGLVVVLLVAGATRFVGLGWLDPWGDEVYSYIASTDLFSKLLHWTTMGNESSSPLPFIEIKIARQVFGNSDWSLRVPAAFYGTASVAVLYLIIGGWMGWSAALASGLWLAVNPFALEWSREGRMYTQWLFYSLLAMALVRECVTHARGPQRSALDWRWWALGVLFMLVHASNVLGVTTIAGLGLWLVLMGLIQWPHQPRAGLTILLGRGSLGVSTCPVGP